MGYKARNDEIRDNVPDEAIVAANYANGQEPDRQSLR
jgi:hypothetical protein